MKGKLYLIPTPIGNVDDITLRALKTLELVDELYCEDTRNTRNLLMHYNLKKKLISMHDHNETGRIEEIKNKINNGLNIGFVSDAGMPVINDPGYKLTREIEDVVVLPGANAAITALVGSSLRPYPFMYFGFLDHKENKKRNQIESLKNIDATIIFYEAKHRIDNTIKCLYDILGNQEVVIARELTKKFEEYIKGTLEQLAKQEINLKGELVVLVDNHPSIEKDVNFTKLYEELIENGMNNKEALSYLKEKYQVSKKDIYNEIHKL